MLRYFPGSSERVLVSVRSGSDAVLQHARLLEAFAEQCAQPGAMHWLAYFLNQVEFRSKQPFLVLVLHAGADEQAPRLEDLRGAGLFIEYRFRGLPTGAFSTDDSSGVRTVVAQAEDRGAVAIACSEALLEAGAHIVLATYEPPAGRDALTPMDGTLLRPGRKWAERSRMMGRDLLLVESYDATLARLGKATRTNLRYYRKRLEQRLTLEFIPDVRAVLQPEEFYRLNERSLNPLDPAEWQLRFASAETLPGSFLVGLRSSEGEWLSLAGGWRQGSTTVMLWQMNASGHEKDSLVNVMRAYLLEHECHRGTRRLVMYGGTSHSMRHAFEQHRLRDLLLRRRSLRAWLLRRLARLFASPRSITGRVNFLAEMLRSTALRWMPTGRPPQPTYSQPHSPRLPQSLRMRNHAAARGGR